MLRNTVFFTSLLFFTNLFSQEAEITFKDALNHAYKNDPNIKKLINSIEIQESNIKASIGSLLPDLKFSSGWTRTNQFIDAGNININGINVPVAERNETSDNFSLSLRSDVILFNGFVNYDRVTLNRQQRLQNLLQLEKYKSDLTFRILNAYITVLKNQKIVEINTATLEDSRKQLEKIRVFVEVGKRTMSDVYRQDVVVAQNELAVEQAKNNLDKSVTELAYSANFPLDKNYSVSGKEFSTDISYDLMEEYINSNSDLDRLVDKALRNRYDYRIAVKNIDLLKANLDIARSSVIFPTISGFSSYSLSGQKITNISNQRIFTVGLSLSYPIFQGFSLDNQRQQAELNLNSARADAELLKNQIALEIKKLIIDMKSLLKQIEITDRNIKNAQQDLLLAEESYRIGTGTVLEINTASVNLTNILINKSNLIYNFILAQKQLEYYQGLLTY